VCNDCGTVFADVDVSRVCINCGARFDVQNAVEHHLLQYRINPLGTNAVELGALRESESKLYDPDFPVYNKIALNDHLRQLFNNRIRYDTELTALQIRFQLPNAQPAHVGPNDINSWLRQVILRLRDSVRNVDIVGMTAADRLTILMPGKGAADIEPVCEKIEQAGGKAPIETGAERGTNNRAKDLLEANLIVDALRLSLVFA
jgi:GGDEF domain-containing protein